MKKDWNDLTQSQKKQYEDKANYLIDRGYVVGKTVEQLAQEIYVKEGMMQ